MDLAERYPPPDPGSWPRPLATLAAVAANWSLDPDAQAALTLAAASVAVPVASAVAGRWPAVWAMPLASRHSAEVQAGDALLRVAEAALGEVGCTLARFTGGGVAPLARTLARTACPAVLHYADGTALLAHLKKFPGRKELLTDLAEGRAVGHALVETVVAAGAPHVGALVNCPREAVAAGATRDDLDRGYLARFLLVEGGSVATLPTAPDPDATRAATGALVAGHRAWPGAVARDAAATALLGHLPAQFDLGPRDPLAGVLMRRASAVAGHFAGWAGRDTVDEADAFAALAVVARGEATRRRLEREVDRDRQRLVMAEVVARLAAAGVGGLTSREVQQQTHHRAADVADALDILIRQHIVAPEEAGHTAVYRIIQVKRARVEQRERAPRPEGTRQGASHDRDIPLTAT